MADNTRAGALELISVVVDLLSRPLSAEERRNGWTDEDRAYYHDLFIRMRTQIEEGNSSAQLDLENINLSRSLDDRGISQGEILHLAATISTVVRNGCNEWF